MHSPGKTHPRKDSLIERDPECVLSLQMNYVEAMQLMRGGSAYSLLGICNIFLASNPQSGMPNQAASMGGFVSAGAAGKVKWNVAPRAPSPLAQICPPCDSTIDLLIARPMPLPCGFVVKNASNIWSTLPRGSPGPLSLIEISIWLSSPNCDFAVSTPPVSFIASMPFSMRFMSTC